MGRSVRQQTGASIAQDKAQLAFERDFESPDILCLRNHRMTAPARYKVGELVRRYPPPSITPRSASIATSSSTHASTLH